MTDPVVHGRDNGGASLHTRIVADVRVSTASAIVTHPDNPYLVLVARSAKHPNPIIPGGKIERDDPAGLVNAPGHACVMREVKEEIDTELLNPRYIGQANDPESDVRIVAPMKLATSVTEPALSTIDRGGVADDVPCIRARYGAPDYIYVGTVAPKAIAETEELSGLKFIDIRKLNPGELSAGHDVIVLKYRDMLDSGATHLDERALTNFQATRLGMIR